MTDAPPSSLDNFIAVSECLTGVVGLDAGLAADYFDRLRAHPRLGSGLGMLVARYVELVDPVAGRSDGSRSAAPATPEAMDEAAGAQLMADPALAPLASQLIYLWYAGAFFEDDPAMPGRSAWDYGGNPEHYGRGLMWSVIRAHAPMTPWPAAPDSPTDAPDAALPDPYWIREPDFGTPVTVPPRWFELEGTSSSGRHADREPR